MAQRCIKAEDAGNGAPSPAWSRSRLCVCDRSRRKMPKGDPTVSPLICKADASQESRRWRSRASLQAPLPVAGAELAGDHRRGVADLVGAAVVVTGELPESGFSPSHALVRVDKMLCLQSLGTDMQRRQFMTLLGGSAAAWPLMARAQVSSKRPLVAVLSGVTRKVNSPIVAFERGMQELGYVDRQNIDIEYRYADGEFGSVSCACRGTGKTVAKCDPGRCYSGGRRGKSTDLDDSRCLSLACRSDRFWFDRK